MKRLFIVLAAFLTLSCTSDSDFEKGKRQLELQGYTNVISTGHSFFTCGKDDTFSTGFIATAPDGTIVEGAFCSGILKGVTIRFE